MGGWVGGCGGGGEVCAWSPLLPTGPPARPPAHSRTHLGPHTVPHARSRTQNNPSPHHQLNSTPHLGLDVHNVSHARGGGEGDRVHGGGEEVTPPAHARRGDERALLNPAHYLRAHGRVGGRAGGCEGERARYFVPPPPTHTRAHTRAHAHTCPPKVMPIEFACCGRIIWVMCAAVSEGRRRRLRPSAASGGKGRAWVGGSGS